MYNLYLVVFFRQLIYQAANKADKTDCFTLFNFVFDGLNAMVIGCCVRALFFLLLIMYEFILSFDNLGLKSNEFHIMLGDIKFFGENIAITLSIY